MDGSNLLAWAGAGTAALSVILGAIVSWKVGVSGKTAEARRDEADAEDKFTGRLLERLAIVEPENARLRAELDQARAERDAEREYSRALRDWIYRQKPPPPPERNHR